jgi:hypothetical protein
VDLFLQPERFRFSTEIDFISFVSYSLLILSSSGAFQAHFLHVYDEPVTTQFEFLFLFFIRLTSALVEWTKYPLDETLIFLPKFLTMAIAKDLHFLLFQSKMERHFQTSDMSALDLLFAKSQLRQS